MDEGECCASSRTESGPEIEKISSKPSAQVSAKVSQVSLLGRPYETEGPARRGEGQSLKAELAKGCVNMYSICVHGEEHEGGWHGYMGKVGEGCVNMYGACVHGEEHEGGWHRYLGKVGEGRVRMSGACKDVYSGCVLCMHYVHL